jgi:hypothetical protein
MHLLFTLASSATLLLAGCRTAAPTHTTQADPHPQARALVRTWRHSQEEDQGAVQVYRPATYSFPPARGREGFAFEPDGRLTKLAIAPTDGTQPLPGRWSWENAHVLHLQVNGQPAQDYRLKVIELTPEVLKISAIENR